MLSCYIYTVTTYETGFAQTILNYNYYIQGRTKLIICFWYALPSEIDQAIRLIIFNFLQN